MNILETKNKKCTFKQSNKNGNAYNFFNGKPINIKCCHINCHTHKTFFSFFLVLETVKNECRPFQLFMETKNPGKLELHFYMSSSQFFGLHKFFRLDLICFYSLSTKHFQDIRNRHFSYLKQLAEISFSFIVLYEIYLMIYIKFKSNVQSIFLINLISII